MDILYERIKQIRQLRGMAQEELAIRSGYTGRSAISRIEKGLVDIPRNKIRDIASALGVSEMYLMGLDVHTQKEQTLLIAFSQLNDAGQDVALNLMQGLVMGGQYRKEAK